MHQGSSRIADELLVLDWQSGNERALRALFDRWHPRLVGYARRLVQSEDGAADVVQEAWLAMLRGIRRLEDPKSFPRWAYRIVTRRASDWIRRRQRVRRSEGTQAGVPIEAVSIEAVPSPDGAVVSNGSIDDADEVTVALARVAEKFRTVLVLRYLEDMHVAEIAKVLGEPVGTIKSRLYHAREAVRPYLTEEA